MPAFNALRRKSNVDAFGDGPSDDLEKVPAHLASYVHLYRFSYICSLTFFLTLSLTTPRTAILNKDGRIEEGAKGVISTCVVLALLAFFLIQNSNPGYVAANSENAGLLAKTEPIGCREGSGDDSVSTKSKNSDFDGLGSEMVDIEIDPTKKLGQPHMAWEDERRHDDSGSDTSDNDSLWDDSEDELELLMGDLEPDQQLDAELAGVSAAEIPIRGKYCRNSRRIVATYDHYCAILGTCIGERNHFRFWLFLLVQTIGLSYLIWVVHTGFHDTTAKVTTWVSYNSHALAAAIILWITILCIGGLFLFHTFLALANMTSYEFMRADRINYLKNTKDFDLPFSNGIRFNLQVFVGQDGLVHGFRNNWLSTLLGFPAKSWQHINWPPVIPIDRDAEDIWENLWENKYWSCC